MKRHSYSLDRGNEFKTWSISCPAEMNAISSYKNIVATGNQSNLMNNNNNDNKFSNVYTNNQTLNYQIIH